MLAFAVPNSDPIAATVDRETAANIGLKWALQFYGVQDVNVEGIEFRAEPKRFWLVSLTANRGGGSATLYAVVLPDASIVEPTVRELALAPP